MRELREARKGELQRKSAAKEREEQIQIRGYSGPHKQRLESCQGAIFLTLSQAYLRRSDRIYKSLILLTEFFRQFLSAPRSYT